MKKHDICIPVIKSGCRYRNLALAYIKKYYSEYFNIIAPEIEEYNPSKARNLSINTSRDDIIVVIDGDVLIDQAIIHAAIKYAKEQEVLVRPFGRLIWLNKAASEYLIKTKYNSEPWKNINKDQLEHPFISYAPSFAQVNEKYKDLTLINSEYGHWTTWGMAYVLNRKLFNRLEGFDERIKKYGWEDIAFVRKIELMNIKTKILFSDAHHLYHTRSMNLDHRIIGPPAEIIRHEYYYNNLKILSEYPYNMKIIFDDTSKDAKHIEMPKVLLSDSFL